ncbi:NAD(P)-dependent oxidoreductase [Candidatus Pelagibacter sp.]|nr:NAD(P)-dependent oxidoreductase [Candidatus Pelagibacter sp.]
MKKICLIGGTGFIGNNIYETLNKNKNLSITRFSSKENRFIDNFDNESFDLLIFCAGIHSLPKDDGKDIFLKNKEIIKKCRFLFDKVDKIIFFSSYKTCFDQNNHKILSSNNYNFYNFETNYGKTKIINEKIFIKFCKYFNKEYLIIAPTHVIGPNDEKFNPNNKFLIDLYKKKIILYPNVNIPIIDVRNIASNVEKIILKNKLLNKKIILNDKNLRLKNYINLIKKKQLFFSIAINLNFILLASRILNFLKIKILNKSRLKYIEMDPIVFSKNNFKKFNIYETIEDTKKFFIKN